MDRWAGRVAVVTGASAGIGAAIATSLVQAGMKVVGCARRQERVDSSENYTSSIFCRQERVDALAEQLKGEQGRLYSRRCDVAEENQIREIFNWIEEHPDLGRVDVCINNAGLSAAETLMEGKVDDWRRMLDVNVLALCLATQLSIKSMTKHGIDDGQVNLIVCQTTLLQVVMVSSFSGHRVPPSPSTRFYAATKFAVTGLLEGWRQEVRDMGSNIRVAAISPGLVETEFQQAMYPGDPERAAAITSAFDCLQSKDMADTVLHILAAPKHVQIHDVLIRPTQQRS